LQPLEVWFSALEQDDFDDIESERDIGIIEQAQPREGAARNQVLLFERHGLGWSSKGVTGARFDLREDECLLVAAYQIDFAAMGRPIIAVEDFAALGPEETRSESLAEGAKVVIGPGLSLGIE
jgi:hypothetical protein